MDREKERKDEAVVQVEDINLQETATEEEEEEDDQLGALHDEDEQASRAYLQFQAQSPKRRRPSRFEITDEHAGRQEIGKMLDSARKTMDRPELQRQFYTDPKRDVARHHLDDHDLSSHHYTSDFPHSHHPLSLRAKPAHKGRKKTSFKRPRSPASQQPFPEEAAQPAPQPDVKADDTWVLPPPIPDETDGKGSDGALSSPDGVGFFIGEDTEDKEEDVPKGSFWSQLAELDTDEPPVASHSASRIPDISSSYSLGEPEPPKHKDKDKQSVRFHLGSREDVKDKEDEEKKEEIKPKHGRRRSSAHKHHKHLYDQDISLSVRRTAGSEVQLEDIGSHPSRVHLEDMDGEDMADADINVMESHRFGETQGIRRRITTPHRALTSIIHVGKAAKVKKKISPKKKPVYDHSPHDLFVELEELYLGEDMEYQWKEKARWIKFEEDVEPGVNRWGKPHVASLSFHSLLELRKCIEEGAILLDLEAEDLSSVSSAIADKLVETDQLAEEEKANMRKALMYKHKHVSDKRDVLRRNISSLNLKGLDHRRHSTGEMLRPSSSGSLKAATSKRRATLAPGMAAKQQQQQQQHVSFDIEKQTVAGLDLMTTTKPKQHSAQIHGMDIMTSSKPNSQVHGMDLMTSPKSNQHTIIDTDLFSPSKAKTDDSLKKKSKFGVDFLEVPVDNNVADGVVFEPATEKQHHSKQSNDIMRRIPEGAEATSVLIGTVDFLERPVMALVRLSEGRILHNMMEVPLPVRFLFVLMGPEDSSMDYHEVGRSYSTLMANPMFHDVAYRADDRQDLLDAINEFLDESIVLPPGEWDKKTLLPIMDMARKKAQEKRLKKERELEAMMDPEEFMDPLARTGRLFGGMIDDIKRRFPMYVSDITDGLNMQCFATFFFIFFACLSPAITFGGLLSDKTDKWIGVSEMLVATSIAGVLFSLLSAQPLVIIGVTGPLVVFDEGLYQICDVLEIDFMAMRLWACVWVAVISTLMVMFEGNFLVRYCTRFTQEIFAALISLIFIIEVFIKLASIFEKHPLQEYYPPPDYEECKAEANGTFDLGTTLADLGTTVADLDLTLDPNMTSAPAVEEEEDTLNQPNTALLSVILTFGTFFIAYFLRKFRNSHFLGRSARRALGDFGVPIAIFIMVLADFLINDTYTEKLDVPDGLTPTAAERRGWFINPMGEEKDLPVWAIFAAVVPALLVFILIFMETQITSMIVNKKDRKLKKGTGYHLGLQLIGSFALLSGFLGLPMLVAATVRSVTHVSALSVYSQTHAPGEKPKLIGVMEQRVTNLAVHVLIGVSVLMSPLLRQVPLAVLFGVFLYMGISSMSGVQLFDRTALLFTPVKHHPSVSYVRKVRTWRMHLFTLTQLVCLGVLWAVKSTEAALAFPFFLIMMVPLRLKILPKLFEEKELNELDREDEGDAYDQDEDEPDFYKQAHMPM